MRLSRHQPSWPWTQVSGVFPARGLYGFGLVCTWPTGQWGPTCRLTPLPDALAQGGPRGLVWLRNHFLRKRKVFKGFCFSICISSPIQKAQNHSLRCRRGCPSLTWPILLAVTEMPNGAG